MEDKARIAYAKWIEKNSERELFFDSGRRLLDKMDEILSAKMCNDVYDLFTDSCNELEEHAFIEGYNYAMDGMTESERRKVEIKALIDGITDKDILKYLDSFIREKVKTK